MPLQYRRLKVDYYFHQDSIGSWALVGFVDALAIAAPQNISEAFLDLNSELMWRVGCFPSIAQQVRSNELAVQLSSIISDLEVGVGRRCDAFSTRGA